MVRSALSTPSPLPHTRKNERHRAAMTRASVDSAAHAAQTCPDERSPGAIAPGRDGAHQGAALRDPVARR